MEHFLTQYSASEIVIFIIVLFFAAKEFVLSFDWAKDRLRQYYDKEGRCEEAHRGLNNKINELSKLFDEQKQTEESMERLWGVFEGLTDQMNMLIESDKEAIKAYITERHHHFVYEKGCIDNYSLECLERRFVIYERENGNSFVGQMMEELRSLPRRPMLDEDDNKK